jgi:lipid A ethanolaminephosphotransferase
VKKNYFNAPIILQPVGRDARMIKHDKPKLIIMVVGEATRADHWGLNGYTPDTTPRLRAQDVVNFSKLYSCGTATAQSVPCMFSKFGRDNFDYRKGIGYENVLDILSHTGKISLLWRDNNSDSKGVAMRIPYEDYRRAARNSICTEGECRDEGMLVGLDKYITEQNGSSILITLHQMGNHGPAYYKRYPKEYALFTPVCTTNQLEKCTQQEISHAYDNAVLHTDAFLSETINLLKQYQTTYEVGLIYMADHGESLGENGVYLHGMPYFMAPDAQKHVAAVMWFADHNRTALLKSKADQSYSHDNLFHTLLGLFDVETIVYEPTQDILHAIP